MKTKFNILCVIAGVILIMAILLTWIIHENSWPDFYHPRTITEHSPLIVYAKVKYDGNRQTYIIQDVWKDARKSYSPLIGLQIHQFISNSPTNTAADGAIIFYEKKPFDSTKLEPDLILFVTGGETDGMSLEQYRKACGL
jgi:hypothetical protein